MDKNTISIQLDNVQARFTTLNEKIQAGTLLTEAETTELRTLDTEIKTLEAAIENKKMADSIATRTAGFDFEKQSPSVPTIMRGIRRSDVDKLFDNYSITRAAQFNAGKINSSDAVAEIEVHDEAEKIARSLGLPTTGQGMLIMTRSDFATALDAGNLGQTQTMPTVAGYQKKIFADKLGAKMYMGLTGINKIPVSDTTAIAGYVAENGSFGAVAANVRSKSLEPHALLAKSTNGWYLKAQAGAESDRVLLDNLLRSEINAVNANIIKSVGAAAPDGAFDDTDVTTITTINGQAISRALLLNVKNSAAANDAEGMSPAWIISPTIQGKLEALAVDAGSGLFVMDPNNPGRLLGYDAHVTTFMPINLASGSGTNLQGVVFGYWENLAIANWAVREIIVDKGSSDTGVVTKLVSFYDHAYVNPKAFAKALFTA